jgi:hypothetical protein
VYKISEIKVLQTVRTIHGFSIKKLFHGNIYLCGISKFLLTVEDLKTATRGCFNDFKLSA